MDPEVDHRWHDAQAKIINFEQSDKILRPDPRASEKETWKPIPSIFQAEQRGPSKFCWLIALTVGIVLAAIAAGVAGSIAVQRQTRLTSCMQAKDVLSSSCAAPPSSNTSRPANTTAPSIHDIKPTSECKTLSSPFASSKGTTYNLECGIDLIETVPDLAGVYVYTFSDCINACAIYNNGGSTGGHGNSMCYAVSYNFALSEDEGNCWLKGRQQIPYHSNETVHSAILAVS